MIESQNVLIQAITHSIQDSLRYIQTSDKGSADYAETGRELSHSIGGIPDCNCRTILLHLSVGYLT
jgi:hypothetical protein